jgi:hypothetical protein
LYHKQLISEQLNVRVAVLGIAHVFEEQRAGVFGTGVAYAFTANAATL